MSDLWAALLVYEADGSHCVCVVFSGAIAGTPFNIDRELLRKGERIMTSFLRAEVQLGGTTGGGYATA